MKKIFAFFTQPWLITVLGLLAISLLIWFVGPLISIAGFEPLGTEFARIIAIVILFVLWGFKKLKNFLQGMRANQKIIDGLSSSEQEPDYSSEEVGILNKRFDEAMAVLKKSRRKKGGISSLYALPWYIIIGPPGSGKTTALVNSGLEFPLAGRSGAPAMQGIGGTRNCDWWFTNKAILLDTAGRYVTQDSHAEVDNAAWFGFLDLLKKHRKRQPINGVLISISISDLMLQNEQERNSHINAIKLRIQELYDRFGIRFPIYVLLTKSDLIAGFMEFFDDLGREERAQVWGATLPLDEEKTADFNPVDSFSQEYDDLVKRLNQRLVWRLNQERDSKRRSLIYGFPQQLAALKQPLESFLKDIFQQNRYEASPLLRGVYFTSGTQEGTPIDRVMGSLARSFGLNQQVLPSYGGQNRSYFITDLLNRVIIPEAQLAGVNHRLERKRAWLQSGAYVGTALLAVILSVGWLTSYSRNKDYITQVSEKSAEAQKALDELSSAKREPWMALDLLNSIRDIPGEFQDPDAEVPWLMSMGLYQGDQLGSKARTAYLRVLSNIFLPRLILRLEGQLQQGSRNPDYLFEGLKVYLMYRDQDHFDADSIKAWLLLDWQNNLPRTLSNEQREQLNQHLESLLVNGPPVLPINLDENLINRTRLTLRRVPYAERVYGRLKRTRFDERIKGFRITDAVGPDAPLVFALKSGKPLNRGIPGLYTYAGFRDVFLKSSLELSSQLAEESWILGDKLPKDEAYNTEKLNYDVRQLYLLDYANQWESLLSDVRLAPVTNLYKAVDMLNVLSAANSPLRRLLIAIKDETSLNKVNELLGKAGEAASDSLNSLKDRLSGILGMETEKVEIKPQIKLDNVVEPRFESLHALVKPLPDGSVPIDSVLLDLNELYVYLNAIASASNRGEAALNAARAQADGNNIISKVKLKAKRQPAFVQDMMIALAINSQNLTVGGVRAHLNTQWSSEALGYCRQAIKDRYPVVRDSTRKITLEDFGQFFGPDGTMDSFFNTYLRDFVDTSSVPWRWRAKGGLSVSALEEFRRARIIKDTFFRGGGSIPSVFFELKPINMDSTIRRFMLEIDKQKITYSHGPIRIDNLQWPGPEGSSQVQIQFQPPMSSGASNIRKIGPWAWFELLDQSNIEATSSPETYIVTFNIGYRKAKYELHASSTHNPFRLKALQQFRCPEKL